MTAFYVVYASIHEVEQRKKQLEKCPLSNFTDAFCGTDQHDELIGASKMLVPCQFTSLAHGMPWKRHRGNALW